MLRSTIIELWIILAVFEYQFHLLIVSRTALRPYSISYKSLNLLIMFPNAFFSWAEALFRGEIHSTTAHCHYHSFDTRCIWHKIKFNYWWEPIQIYLKLIGSSANLSFWRSVQWLFERQNYAWWSTSKAMERTGNLNVFFLFQFYVILIEGLKLNMLHAVRSCL